MSEGTQAVGDDAGAITLDRAAELLGERRREAERDEPGRDEPGRDEPPALAPEVEPPSSWDAEDKAEFRKLAPEAQQRIAARERQRAAEIETRQREVAEQRKAADAERRAAAALLVHSLPGMAKAVQEKYAAVDWAALAKEDAAGYVAKRAEYDADLGRLDAAHREAERMAATLTAKAQQDHRAFLEREKNALARLVPDLADEAKGPALRESLRAFALEAGYTPDQIAWASARDIATLHDAYRWRQAQTRLAQSEKRPVPAVQRPGVATDKGEREAAAYSRGLERLERTGRIEDALALLKLKRKG